ncbi:hypothetical protein SKAU_G00082490 [Synaphobranchus kaupii]|uniref:Uncharacterized protein n=1 Tax=Synaphobranchus kaupii TaxID=118154 RepID=A0A9Q1J5M6_SYNKA|nr:hypothetical protein SKAU_G00082490 [Synaphobranchus kaupii]
MCAGISAWRSRGRRWTRGPRPASLTVWSALLTPPSPSPTASHRWYRRGPTDPCACVVRAYGLSFESKCLVAHVTPLGTTHALFLEACSSPVMIDVTKRKNEYGYKQAYFFPFLKHLSTSPFWTQATTCDPLCMGWCVMYMYMYVVG